MLTMNVDDVHIISLECQEVCMLPNYDQTPVAVTERESILFGKMFELMKQCFTFRTTSQTQGNYRVVENITSFY